MGKPAARIGDMTAHGGTIVAGLPTVLIGGMPAARLTDMHVCPMVTPGVPPIPHVGGPITLGSAGVLIGSMPAARVGDMAVCVGPPDTIAMGCFTVLIGETGAGGGGGGGGGAGGSGAATSNAGAAAASGGAGPSGGAGTGPGGGESAEDRHWLDIRFVDGAGYPIAGLPFELEGPDGERTLGQLAHTGQARRDGLTQTGSGTVRLFAVTNARWSSAEAEAGEALTLAADVSGYADGTPAEVRVYERDLQQPARLVERLEGEVSGGQVEVEWTHPHPEDEEPHGAGTEPGYSNPRYFFEVRVGAARGLAPLLRLRDYLEIELRDREGNPIAEEDYIVYLPDGSVREGQLDDQGRARIEEVSPRTCRVAFPNLPPEEGSDEEADEATEAEPSTGESGGTAPEGSGGATSGSRGGEGT